MSSQNDVRLMGALVSQCSEAAGRLANFADLLKEELPIGHTADMVETLKQIQDYAEGILGDSAKAEDALDLLSKEIGS